MRGRELGKITFYTFFFRCLCQYYSLFLQSVDLRIGLLNSLKKTGLFMARTYLKYMSLDMRVVAVFDQITKKLNLTCLFQSANTLPITTSQ